MDAAATSSLLLQPHQKDLGGGFVVRRLLPAARRRAVGPWVFFDHFGPVTERPQDNHDVRPHPHIGLATVTYLFEGAMLHKDSLGTEQLIEPGAINWMSAGRGIVHSERKPLHLRSTAFTNHGLQLWLALPEALEESEPSFQHVPAAEIPQWSEGPATLRLLVGQGMGRASPVRAASPTLYLDVRFDAAGTLALPPLAEELALYAVDAPAGPFQVDGQPVAAHQMLVLGPQAAPRVSAAGPGRCVLVGGQPLGPRFMWWNFVSSRAERIRQAAADWQAGRFPAVPGETESIPLPSQPLPGG